MRRGQYPNPTFLNKAEGIRKERHTKTVVAITALLLIALTVVFIRAGARMQTLYEQEYPDLVGAATATTTEDTEPNVIVTLPRVSVAETTVETEESEEVLVPVIVTEVTEETIDLQNLNPDIFEEPVPFHFRSSYPLQTISHEQRDVLLDVLKQNVQDYIADNPSERICFRYINLDNGETMGLNDLEPIVPAGAFALPIEMTFWHRIDMGFGTPEYVVTYDGSYVPGRSSFIADTYPAGKMFYIRTLANLAISDNDDYALGMILERANGMETVWNYVSGISSYINYTDSVTYNDYQGTLMRGSGRTSCYDMAAYAESLYYSYIADPEVYQPLINDLYYNEVPSPFTTSFGEGTSVLHVSGRNETFHAYTDIAIIDSFEPVVLIVYCECSSFDRAQIIQADLSGYLNTYLEACHAP